MNFLVVCVSLVAAVVALPQVPNTAPVHEWDVSYTEFMTINGTDYTFTGYGTRYGDMTAGGVRQFTYYRGTDSTDTVATPVIARGLYAFGKTAHFIRYTPEKTECLAIPWPDPQGEPGFFRDHCKFVGSEKILNRKANKFQCSFSVGSVFPNATTTMWYDSQLLSDKTGYPLKFELQGGVPIVMQHQIWETLKYTVYDHPFPKAFWDLPPECKDAESFLEYAKYL